MIKFSEYISKAVAGIKGVASQRVLSDLLNKIYTTQSCKVWTISEDKAEYERFTYLLEKADTVDSGINVGHINALLQEQGSEQLKNAARVIFIHDPSDIRKPHSKMMENIDKVKGLDGKMINGYPTFNSIALDSDRIHLLGCTPYSKKEDNYKGEDPVLRFDKKQVAFDQMRAASAAFKAQNPNQVRIHLFDREADDQDFFAFIDQELEDKFVIRLKLNRNSDVYTWQEEEQREIAVKLAKKTLDHQFCQLYEHFVWRGKSYRKVSAKIAYERVFLGQGWYNVVRVELFNRMGKPIFTQPMLLVTNFEVNSQQMASYVYHLYLKRSKIEGVFKFLKVELGWEEFQVQDFFAIKHIIVLCYFVGAYFY